MAWLEVDAETRLWAVPGSLVAGARPRLCLSESQLSPVPVLRGPSVTCPCCGQGCDLHTGDMKRFHGSVEIRGPGFQLSLPHEPGKGVGSESGEQGTGVAFEVMVCQVSPGAPLPELQSVSSEGFRVMEGLA